MTKKDAIIGNRVYLKKSIDLSEHKHIIIDHVFKNKGYKAKLEDGTIRSFGDLTDVKCSEMKCSACKYH